MSPRLWVRLSPKIDALGLRVVDRCPLAGEIGKHDQALGTRRRRLRLPGETREGLRRIELARGIVAEPVGQRAAGRQPGHRPMLALEQPWRIPQPRILDAAFRQHDREDRRAVHHHHVAAADDTDAERFRRRIDGAGNHRRADGKPGRARRLRRHMAGDVGRPQKPRQAIEPDDVGGELAAPVLPVDDIERREIGSGIVVDHAFARQFLHEIGRRRDDLRGLGEDLRAVLLQPQDLRPDRLRCQRIAAALEDAFCPDRGVELLDLRGWRAHRRRRARRWTAPRHVRRPAACTGRWHSPRPRESLSGASFESVSIFLQMKVKSPHQSCLGLCSAQPGCGTSILCGFEAVATILPLPSTMTPFDSNVPMSMPR